MTVKLTEEQIERGKIVVDSQYYRYLESLRVHLEWNKEYLFLPKYYDEDGQFIRGSTGTPSIFDDIDDHEAGVQHMVEIVGRHEHVLDGCNAYPTDAERAILEQAGQIIDRFYWNIKEARNYINAMPETHDVGELWRMQQGFELAATKAREGLKTFVNTTGQTRIPDEIKEQYGPKEVTE